MGLSPPSSVDGAAPTGVATATMQNEEGKVVDLYMPRKCDATNCIIAAKDHASVQINIAQVDKATGRATGKYDSFALCGAVRSMAEADDSMNRLTQEAGILNKVFQAT